MLQQVNRSWRINKQLPILSRRSGLLEELNKFRERKVQKLTQSNESPAMWIKIDDRQAIFAIISSYADSQKKRILDAIKEKPSTIL